MILTYLLTPFGSDFGSKPPCPDPLPQVKLEVHHHQMTSDLEFTCAKPLAEQR